MNKEAALIVAAVVAIIEVLVGVGVLDPVLAKSIEGVIEPIILVLVPIIGGLIIRESVYSDHTHKKLMRTRVKP